MTTIITGASSGLGRAIVTQMAEWEPTRTIIGIVKDEGEIVHVPKWMNVVPYVLDLNGYIHKDRVADLVGGKYGHINTIVNCAGVNEINWLQDLDYGDWDNCMRVNAGAIWQLVQTFLPHLKETLGTVCNIVSNASHVPMTASLAYNASKAAAHMITLQMARELTKKHGITVFGISPAKLKGTGMSRYIEGRVCEVRGWDPKHAAAYQAQGLLTGQEIEPYDLAEFICFLLEEKRRHFHLSGCVLPYGA